MLDINHLSPNTLSKVVSAKLLAVKRYKPEYPTHAYIPCDSTTQFNSCTSQTLLH